MNAFAIVILATLIGDYALNLFADALNLSRAAKRGAGVLSKTSTTRKNIENPKSTCGANTRFSRIVSTFDLAVLLVFWFSGGFQYVDGIVRFTGMGPIATGLAFVGVLILAKGVLSLPFAIYDTFVIEERFGFNRTTVKTFVMDRIKGVLLGVWPWAVLWRGGHPVVLQFRRDACLGLLLDRRHRIFPVHPLHRPPPGSCRFFNKFSELAEGDLKTAIFAYADSIRFPLEQRPRHGRLQEKPQEQRLFHGFRQEQADRAVRHPGGKPYGGGTGGGPGARDGPLQEETHIERHAAGNPGNRADFLSAVRLYFQRGAVRRVFYGTYFGLRGPGLFRDALRAPGIFPGTGHTGDFAEERIRGGPIRRNHHPRPGNP